MLRTPLHFGSLQHFPMGLRHSRSPRFLPPPLRKFNLPLGRILLTTLKLAHTAADLSFCTLVGCHLTHLHFTQYRTRSWVSHSHGSPLPPVSSDLSNSSGTRSSPISSQRKTISTVHHYVEQLTPAQQLHECISSPPPFSISTPTSSLSSYSVFTTHFHAKYPPHIPVLINLKLSRSYTISLP